MSEPAETDEKPKKPGSWNRTLVKRISGVVIACVAFIALALALANIVYVHATDYRHYSKDTYVVDVCEEAREKFTPVLEQLSGMNPSFTLQLGSENPDIVIDVDRKDGFHSFEVETFPPLEIIAGKKTITLREKESYWLSYRKEGLLFKKVDPNVISIKRHLQKHFGPPPATTMNAVGDIVPARHVAEKMAEHGVEYPFEKIAPYVRDADIVFGDLECPLSDRFEPPYTGMEFVAPSETIEGIKLLGINILAVANNHIFDFGTEAFTDTLELLKSNNIQYVGGGYDYQEAHAPAVMEANGKKFAFLDYNSVKWSKDATEDEPGVAFVGMPPYYEDNPEHIQMVQDNVRSAKENADYVIASFHWSKEYEYYPSSSMQNLARKACDAGADMVIGSHPHTIQPIEYYNGKIIAYSLGNFVFDQMQSDQTREGFIMKCRFYDNLLTRIELVPYKIYDYCQPRVLTGDDGQRLLDEVLEISGRG